MYTAHKNGWRNEQKINELQIFKLFDWIMVTKYVPGWQPNIPEYSEMPLTDRASWDCFLGFLRLLTVRWYICIEFSSQSKCYSATFHIWPVERNGTALFGHRTMVCRLDQEWCWLGNQLFRWSVLDLTLDHPQAYHSVLYWNQLSPDSSKPLVQTGKILSEG